MTDTQDDDQPHLSSYWRAPVPDFIRHTAQLVSAEKYHELEKYVALKNEEVARLKQEVALWKDRFEEADQALDATIKQWNDQLSQAGLE